MAAKAARYSSRYPGSTVYIGQNKKSYQTQKSVSSLFMNNFQMLSKCCHEDILPFKNPVSMRVCGVLTTIRTRQLLINFV